MVDEEFWFQIDELGDTYQVSSLGRVRSVDRVVLHKDGKTTNHKSRVLKQSTNPKGYKVVYPTFNGVKKSLVVHRLVAKACCPNYLGLPQVNHIDEDKTNNHWTNLEWCTNEYNIEYSQARSGLFFSPEGELVKVKNLAKFSRENGLCNGKLADLLNGKRKTHKGWKAYETPRD